MTACHTPTHNCKMPEISVIIVNYKSRHYIESCINSVFDRMKDMDFEVIIVNNDSSSLPAPNSGKVRIINAGKNLGFGRANNLGIREAKGKYVFFLNPDTLLLSENIGKIVDKFENDSRIGIVGPKLIDIENKVQKWSAGADVTLIDLLKNNLGFPKSKEVWESAGKKEADWVSGSTLFIRKDLFSGIGGFDDNFFMYFEDIDLCKRVRDKGYEVLYFPEVEVRHLGGKSFEGENKKTQKKYYYASQDYYFEKHFGKLAGWTVKGLRKVFK